MSVSMKRLGQNDLELFIELIKVFERVFEMEPYVKPGSMHLKRLLSDEKLNVFVALHGNKVVGGLTTYILEQYYSERPLAYIFDLGVLPEMQRKGIGKSLIDQCKQYYRSRGFEEVFVQADEVDQHALAFYRNTGLTAEERVRHFYYSLNK